MIAEMPAVDEPSREKRSLLGQQIPLLEASAKGIAALGAAAIATGFIYDAVRYQWLDRRLLGLFVLSDHIETAVSSLVLIAISWAIVVAFSFFTMPPRSLNKGRWWVSVIVYVAIWGIALFAVLW